ncbi:MAG TPA: sensor histidine kinase [Nitrolancea sp.]|jgi:two-component system sensor histidine kinase DesK|nr:sensor histidine kinase [Nitrolancea sp.]
MAEIPADSSPSIAMDVQHWKQRRSARLFGLAWLFYLVYPFSDLIRGHQPTGQTILGAVGLIVFVAIYLYAYFRTFYNHVAVWRTWAPVVVLALIATVVTLWVNHSWIGIMIYVATAAGCSLTERTAIRAMIGLSAYTMIVGTVSGASFSSTVPITIEVLLIGATMLFLRRLITTNGELRRAREENARLAVAEERLRFARDLHDLLGHSLSLIALKSELAGRLIEVNPQRAQAEIRDIEQVTRDALREVREAVSGYRQPDLSSELYGARTALEAAGIDCQISNQITKLAPSAEAALGWAVREGVTNVIRHSGASLCHIELRELPEMVQLMVSDNGTKTTKMQAPQNGRSGTGIAGLRERVAALGGQIETDQQSGGGFRLTVQLPASETSEQATEGAKQTATAKWLALGRQL